MKYFVDYHHVSLNKAGEELCGDQVRMFRAGSKTRIVLSDGLGSGVKANILASLTSEIIINMLREQAAMNDVIETVAGTLPVCKVRNLAYATFTLVEIDHDTLCFNAYNFDNPPLLYFSGGKYQPLTQQETLIAGKKVQVTNGQLTHGDFLAVMSDGVPYAGLGVAYNLGWGIPNITAFIEDIFQFGPTGARSLVERTMGRTRELYADQPGDDASMVGMLIRPSQTAMVFTGPPMSEADDEGIVNRLMAFEGRKIVCGGTTGNIVSAFTGEPIETDIASLREDLPPIGLLEGIDLLTEGIITLSHTMDLLEKSQGNPASLPRTHDGAHMLAQELLNADEIFFLVGQKITPYYQNPLLPENVSIRKNLVEKIAAILVNYHKEVRVEYH